MRDKAKVRPLIYGGGQQKGFRSGTENVPGIAGLGVAAELFCKNRSTYVEQMYACKKHLIEGLEVLEDVTVKACQGFHWKRQHHILSRKFCRSAQ